MTVLLLNRIRNIGRVRQPRDVGGQHRLLSQCDRSVQCDLMLKTLRPGYDGINVSGIRSQPLAGTGASRWGRSATRRQEIRSRTCLRHGEQGRQPSGGRCGRDHTGRLWRHTEERHRTGGIDRLDHGEPVERGNDTGQRRPWQAPNRGWVSRWPDGRQRDRVWQRNMNRQDRRKNHVQSGKYDGGIPTQRGCGRRCNSKYPSWRRGQSVGDAQMERGRVEKRNTNPGCVDTSNNGCQACKRNCRQI